MSMVDGYILKTSQGNSFSSDRYKLEIFEDEEDLLERIAPLVVRQTKEKIESIHKVSLTKKSVVECDLQLDNKMTVHIIDKEVDKPKKKTNK